MPEGAQTDAFGRPLQGEETDAFGAPVAEPAPTWQPPVAAAEWQPPVVAVTAAGWWPRAVAAILDTLVAGFAGVVLGAIVAGLLDASDNATTAIAAGAWIVTAGTYYCLLMGRGGARNGQTLGKQAVGIRVVRVDGAPVEPGFAFVREVLVKILLFGYIAFVTLYLATFVNYLWPLWDPRKQALHDKIVRSRVVKT